MARIAVAALSARALAEAAQRDGHEVLALDLFGDRDTRAAASLGWHSLAGDAGLRIDGERLLNALRAAPARGLDAWVWGSGLEGRPELLAQGAAVLPLWGTPSATVAAVRDPQRFFAALQAYGIAHPPVQFRRPEALEGWLHKSAASSGGWGVRAAHADDTDPPAAGEYWQREVPGRPMSLTLLADGQAARVLGVNAQQTVAWHGRPHVFVGVVGPVALPGRLPTALQGLADRLVRHFKLRGLCGVDFLLHGDEVLVLEVNPRPPASAQLYARLGLFNAHVTACLESLLPKPDEAVAPPPAGPVRGLRHVPARRPMPLDATRQEQLAAWPGVHDVPHQATTVAAGDPVCSLSAEGLDACTVAEALSRSADALLKLLETPT